VGVKNSCQAFFFLILFPGPAGGGKHTSNLGKYTNGMNGVDVSDDVRVSLFVFQEKGAQVGLSALHHFLDSGDNMGIANDDCLVETGE
jgi:hypothetical protein